MKIFICRHKVLLGFFWVTKSILGVILGLETCFWVKNRKVNFGPYFGHQSIVDLGLLGMGKISKKSKFQNFTCKHVPRQKMASKFEFLTQKNLRSHFMWFLWKSNFDLINFITKYHTFQIWPDFQGCYLGLHKSRFQRGLSSG